jgi:hypothetical protein
MIGAKEGVVKALTALVGTNITDSVLRTSDGDFKSVDEYTVHKVMQAAYENADRPPMTDVLEQLIEVLHDQRKHGTCPKSSQQDERLWH